MTTDTALADVPVAEVLAGGPPSDDRDERLDDGAATLAEGKQGGSLILNERFLLAAAGACMTSGLVAIILGWVGASRSILVVKQIPYLISGGLLGVALATIGGLMFFSHWVAALGRQGRWQHQELLRVLREERELDREAMAAAITTAIREVREEATANGTARSAAAQRPVRRAPRSS